MKIGLREEIMFRSGKDLEKGRLSINGIRYDLETEGERPIVNAEKSLFNCREDEYPEVGDVVSLKVDGAYMRIQWTVTAVRYYVKTPFDGTVIKDSNDIRF